MILKKYLFIPLWRLWFYLLILLVIIIALPVLVVSISRKEWYPFFFKLARLWATVILYGMGFIPKVVGPTPNKSTSYIFVANHTSMIDIMLMLYTIKDNPFVFIGKKELSKIPIFGFFYRRTSILVNRSNTQSRKQAIEAAQQRINEGLSICIFPEGGVPDDHSIILDEFKDGAFRLAVEHQIEIVPITFYDTKKRFSYDFFSGSPGLLRVKIHSFVSPQGQDKKTLKNLVRELMLQELLHPKFPK
jgi:1-acyl-sn-glycerol-3-phosphate acyltransferase